MIYWFRADLLKGKDPDLNFTTYSSQFPQICPLFNFLKLSFYGFIYCLICLDSSVIPFPLSSSVVPFPQLTNIQLHWGIGPNFVFLEFICPLSHFPKFLRLIGCPTFGPSSSIIHFPPSSWANKFSSILQVSRKI